MKNRPVAYRLIGLLLLLGIVAVAAVLRYPPSPPPQDTAVWLPPLSPTQYHAQIAARPHAKTRQVRIAGMVKPQSVYPLQGGGTGFIIADAQDELHVTYPGALPMAFDDGAHVLAQGMVNDIGVLEATILTVVDDGGSTP